MAKSLGTETVALTGEERTWRVEIFIEKGEDPTIRAHRERVWTDAAGKVARRERGIPVVQRSLSQIATKTVSGVTGNQLAGIIADWADALRQEDTLPQ